MQSRSSAARARNGRRSLSSHRTNAGPYTFVVGLRHKVAALLVRACESGCCSTKSSECAHCCLPRHRSFMRAVSCSGSQRTWQRLHSSSGSHGPRSASYMSHSMPSNTQRRSTQGRCRPIPWRRAKRAPKPEGRTKNLLMVATQ